MKIVNFAHPLTTEQLAAIETLTDQKVEEVISVASQVDTEQPLVPQVEVMLDKAGFSGTDWQTLPLLINLPALNYSTAVMLALLHGKMGYFPAILRIRPQIGTIPPRFEAGEIINLQVLREHSRLSR